METTFSNLTVTIPAVDSKEAYAMLCSALARIGAEWKSDTYTTDQSNDRFMSTRSLMPPID